MSDNEPKLLGPAFGEVAPSTSNATALTREAEGWQIRDTMEEVLRQIGQTPLIMRGAGGWWEGFSHGLSMPIQDHLYPGLKDVATFIQRETDFLDLDEEGFKRTFGRGFGVSDRGGGAFNRQSA